MFRSLYAKLAGVLVGLLALTGALALTITWLTAGLYHEEISQKLNRELARHVVGEKRLLHEGVVDRAAWEELFHMLMVINPGIELYLLDPGGRVLAYSAPPEKVQRSAIALAPVREFIDGHARFPLYGDDPRDTRGQKVFSAAPIMSEGRLNGYLYVILSGKEYDSVANKLAGSFILRVSVWVLLASLLVAALAGLFLFKVLTCKLRRLSSAMDSFKDTEAPDGYVTMQMSLGRGDEIQRLGVAFSEMARRLKEQMHALERTDQQRRELVANVSHDLRTPLATLQGYIETLRMKDGKLTEDERCAYLDTALRHCLDLNRRVAELLELSKFDAQEIQVRCEPFSLAELVQDTLQKFKLAARAKGVNIETRAAADVPFVHADIGLVERVLDNLLDNALRHTPPGGDIRVTLASGLGRVTVEVSDTGCGIPADELQRIFERFHQVDKSRNRYPGASGLGLAIAKRILDLHGAAIDVKSTLDAGTTFRFDLPAHS